MSTIQRTMFMPTFNTAPGLQEVIAWAAAGLGAVLVIAGSLVRTMIPLRCLAVGSNIGFVLYGLLLPSPLVLLLHASLLPFNLYRLAEMIRVTRRVAQVAAQRDLSGVWLRPYMRSARLPAGHVLFRKGDVADRLYLLVDGSVELVEIQQTMEPGRIFGEIALFSPEKRRGLSARCVTASTVLSIDEGTVKQLYLQNPAFGFDLVTLIAGRLGADVARLEQELARRSAPAAVQSSADVESSGRPPSEPAPTRPTLE